MGNRAQGAGLLRGWGAGIVGFLCMATGCGGPAFLEPEAGGVAFKLQGEYAAPEAPVAAQVVALGDSRFRAVFLSGGLPGAGYDGSEPSSVEALRDGEQIVFAGPYDATLSEGNLKGTTPDGAAFSLPRVERASPTLGAAPPAGATVLFDGKGAGGFDGELDARGLLKAGASSTEAFGDIHLHLEFRTPFMPQANGQARGNSGVYLQGRYEIQVLDSFGLAGADNECGGIYEVAAPAVNMAFPPLAWQTYDIDFVAARFDAAGSKLANARVTVRHNGVTIHQDQEIPEPTGLGNAEDASPGTLDLQDHWNPVFYRNVWLEKR